MSTYGYRRGSIFWALTLIAVGGLFLYQNFNPSVRAWQIIARFWPALIIFWGVSKLIDHLQARAHPETTPPPLFTMSEVILLLLILVFGTLASKLILHPWQRWPHEFGINMDDDWANAFYPPFTFTDNLTERVKPQPRLRIEDQKGDVEIHASDQPSIDLATRKVVRAEDEAAAKKIADQIKVELAEQAGDYVLRSNRRSLPGNGQNVSLNLTLRVPRQTSTDLTSERGDILLDGLRGDQTLTAAHGDLRVNGVEGLLRVHKSGGSTDIRDVKGSVDIDGRGGDIAISSVSGSVTVNGDFSGSVQFREIPQTLRYVSTRTNLSVQKLSGSLDMDLDSLDAHNIGGPFELSTKQKDVTLDEFNHAVKISDTNGELELRTSVPPTHPIDVELKKGGITLEIPETSSLQVDATSQHGQVECDFTDPGLKIENEGDAPSIKGTLGKGGPLVRLSTSYGTIHIVRTGAPHAPKAPPHSKAPNRARLAPWSSPVRTSVDRTCRLWIEGARSNRSLSECDRQQIRRMAEDFCARVISWLGACARPGS